MRITSERDFEVDQSAEDLVEQDVARATGNSAVASGPLIGANDSSVLEQYLVESEPRSKPAIVTQPSGAVSRIFDCVVAATLLIALLPVMLVIALTLKIVDPGPILFAHRRVGRGGKIFPCFKFRTMSVDADERLARILAQDEELLREWTSTQKLLDDPRVTLFGNWLRNTSLDELPQLFNVLRGDMALVGPRPIVQDELSRYGRYATSYYLVRPGLTGLWQVTRNIGTTYRRRVATDVFYVRNRSFAFDLRILFATIPAVWPYG